MDCTWACPLLFRVASTIGPCIRGVASVENCLQVSTQPRLFLPPAFK